MSIAQNIEDLKKRIETSAKIAGRDPLDIKLLSITKTHSVEAIEIALDNNIEFIGENRVQEAEQKLPFLKGRYKEFHFVGHLQSNKIKQLMKLEPALIHSIDTLSTAQKLNDHLSGISKKQAVLVQVNASGEESKFGIKPEETLDFINDLSELPNLKVEGLMTIGMFTTNEENIRNCFRTLKKLFEKIKENPKVEMKYLSMGMTNDFEIAIEEGANIIRIGSAIFGSRNKR
ncbi:MAG: YggS family pyridoxal phosphate-dependent enzyme [Candidatus Cloacimonetes bacterium]|nr:YggS family pyridoxal phosphate-dependent enzyme [Candidatus Cloacimonadota bacterium]